MTCKNQRRFSFGGNCLFLFVQKCSMYFIWKYYATFFPKSRCVFCRSGCRCLMSVRGLPPKFIRMTFPFPASFYIRIIPQLCAGRIRQQRKSSQLHTRRKYRCPRQTGQRYFLSSLIIEVTMFSAAVCSSIFPAVCEFPGTVLRSFSVFLSRTRSEYHSLSWALPDQPRSLNGISFLFH